MTKRTGTTLPAFVQPGGRSGLSLLELLLVLGIISLVMTFAVPAMLEANSLRQIQNDAEQVIKGISMGRARAIETGLAYQFRFEPGGNKFVMVPDPALLSQDQNDSNYYRIAGVLGQDMEFRLELESAGPGEQLSAEWFEGLGNAGDLAGAQWSDPIEFSFEGSADDGFFYLLDEQKRSIRFRVRGLTGAVVSSKVSFEIAEQ